MSDATQHYSSPDITSAPEEAAFQEAEKEQFFSDAGGSGEIESYTLADADAASIVSQLEVTNGLLGTLNAILIVFAIFGVMRFIMRLVDHNIFKYI